MAASMRMIYRATGGIGRAAWDWAMAQSLDQFNDYIQTNARWNVVVQDYVRYYGRYVNGYNDLRGNLYCSSHYVGSRVEAYKLITHEACHNWYRGHHASPGMVGKGGHRIYTFTPADFSVMRVRRKPGVAPWDDPRNKPSVVAETVVVDPGWYGYIDVLSNDTQARGWKIYFHGNRAVSSDPRVETAAINGPGIKVATYPEFKKCTIKYQVRTEMGADSAVWAELTLVAKAPEYAWTNPDDRYDVDNSGRVTSRDALLALNRSGMEVDTSFPPEDSSGNRIYPDVNEDGRVTSRDALAVINQLGRYRG